MGEDREVGERGKEHAKLKDNLEEEGGEKIHRLDRKRNKAKVVIRERERERGAQREGRGRVHIGEEREREGDKGS